MARKRRNPKPAPESRGASRGHRRRFLLAGAVGALLVVVFFVSTRQNETPPSPATGHAAAPSGQGELASYRVDGETVHVNNRLCAVSRSALADETIGRFQSHVVYDGPVEEFRGKTLIFNQCCEVCEERFPSQWASKRDEIMRFHGLTR